MPYRARHDDVPNRLFDFDLTLFDTDGAEAHAFDSTVAQLGIERVAAHYDAYRDINQALWDAVHAGELTPGDVHVSRFEQWVATNAPADVQRPRIDRLGIEDLFDAITISTEAGSAKPDTGIFDVTFEALGWPDKSGAVIVGDKWWEVFRSRE